MLKCNFQEGKEGYEMLWKNTQVQSRGRFENRKRHALY